MFSLSQKRIPKRTAAFLSLLMLSALPALTVFAAPTQDAAPVSAAAAVPQETITITADVWCPYNCDPTSEHPGFMIEMAQKAFAKHGINIQYIVQPWTRAIEETRQGKYTAIVGAAVRDAPDFVFPEKTEGKIQNVFYIKKGKKWRYTGIDSLKDVSLGVIADYSYNTALDEYVAAHKTDPKHIQVIAGDDALNINFKKLLAGRIDSYVEGEFVAQYYIAQHKISDQIEEAGRSPPSVDDQLYIAFGPENKKAKEYAAILSEEIKAMRADGELEKLLAVYNIRDWDK
jgi:polar amino acid transport system substrate-binding protein